MPKTRKPDPLTETRRAALQAFCKAKGWYDGSDWAVTEAAAFFGKKKQAMTNLLRGFGSFGPTVARSLENGSHEELVPGELDGLADDRDFQDIPRIDVRLAAGDGAIEGIEEVIGTLKFASSFLREVRTTPSRARIVSVRGHSMHPAIPDGAVVLVNTSDASREPVDGAVFVLARPVEGLTVKRLKFEDGHWVATSDNPAGPRIQIDDGEPVKIIGRAVWMGSKL